jgi:hypothetical protein
LKNLNVTAKVPPNTSQVAFVEDFTTSMVDIVHPLEDGYIVVVSNYAHSEVGIEYLAPYLDDS